MRRNRHFGVALAALLVALLLISGTGSFSAMSGERTAQITVVDDADAYLGVEQEIVGNSESAEDHSTTETAEDHSTTETAEDTSAIETADLNTAEDDASADKEVSTASDDNSTSSMSDATESTQTLELTVTNRFTHGVTLEASVGKESKSTDEALDTGESLTFTFDSVDCGEWITIEATGSSVEATLERTVECD